MARTRGACSKNQLTVSMRPQPLRGQDAVGLRGGGRARSSSHRGRPLAAHTPKSLPVGNVELLISELDGGRGDPAVRHDDRDVGTVDLAGGAVADLEARGAHRRAEGTVAGYLHWITQWRP